MPVKKMRRAFSLLELLIVIIIVVILAAIALPNYYKAKEHSLDHETQANLKLIQAAEKIYKLEIGGYYGTSTLSDINTYLKLSLPTGTNRNWDYGTNNTGCGQSKRNGGDLRQFHIQIADDEPVSNACP